MSVSTLVLAVATVVAGEREFTTYPYSDPDPIPCTAENRYPYCRYDAHSWGAVRKKWKTVTLENTRIRVTLLPEIGGKIWGATEKKTGKDFIYFNDVVKFRDIAMRGPWCSGGIEFNFGRTGHAPWTAAPVDWCVRTNADGSASYFCGGMEQTGGTRWQVEVNLPGDAGHFLTRVLWHNASATPGSCYNWMTAAYSARGEPEFIYPGLNQIDHDGTVYPWPVDAKGRDCRLYTAAADVGSVSWHVINGDNRFFGIWWPRLGYGSAHENPVTDRCGRKIFLWSQARDGAIWEDLLTDTAGQYVELQAGRGFQQQTPGCEKTPFKYETFFPGETHCFEDKWSYVSSEKKLRARAVLVPDAEVARPVKSPADFDYSTAYGSYILGQQKLRDGRDVSGGEKLLEASLAKEPYFVPALEELAALAYRRGDYAKVEELAAKALSVDAYAPLANFLAGSAAIIQGRLDRARERFGVAAHSPLVRAGAYVALAKLGLAQKDWPVADAFAARAASVSADDPEAALVHVVALRKLGKAAEAGAAARRLLERWPLFTPARYELGTTGAAGDVRDSVRGEFPAETFIDTAAWYEAAGLHDDARALYALASGHPVAAIRSAYLGRDTAALAAAKALKIDFAFPFRPSSLPALRWAVASDANWKFKYYLAVYLKAQGKNAEGDELLAACGNEPASPVFYLYRAKGVADLTRAAELGDSWRVGRALAAAHVKDGNRPGARKVLEEYLRRYPGNNALEIAYARVLAELKAYNECVAFLRGVRILPSEFGSNACKAWQKSHQALAEAACDAGDAAKARHHLEQILAYPENLGSGRPGSVDGIITKWPDRLQKIWCSNKNSRK
ncbi:MAG: DUF5107 domain-containing protein [Kiritimatiellae bacterium]|nr:DUF5107 domain-containing protein [Kiritimatiellia bacterium]